MFLIIEKDPEKKQTMLVMICSYGL